MNCLWSRSCQWTPRGAFTNAAAPWITGDSTSRYTETGVYLQWFIYFFKKSHYPRFYPHHAMVLWYFLSFIQIKERLTSYFSEVLHSRYSCWRRNTNLEVRAEPTLLTWTNGSICRTSFRWNVDFINLSVFYHHPSNVCQETVELYYIKSFHFKAAVKTVTLLAQPG